MIVERKLEQFLDEDVGNGDITTDSLVDPTTRSIGHVICKERATVSGLAESIILLKLVGCEGKPKVRDGQEVPAGTVVLEVSGRGIDLLKVERTLLKDRKSTRLNSSHLGISYAVFCLKKKNEETN